MSNTSALRSDLPVGEAVFAIARDILSDARTAIESPDHSDAKAVHQFRRGMKQWRALLRLLEPFLGEQADELLTAARDIARNLGGARDMQSALDALDNLKAGDLALSERSLKTVRKRIDDLRTAGEMRALTPTMRLRIAEVLADADAAVNRWTLDRLKFSDIAKQLAGSYREARHAVPKRWSDANPEVLHELRKLVVIHGYQMQIVRPLWKRFAKMWIAEAQRLRQRLGQHQDLDVLQKLAEPGQPLAHWHSKLDPAITAHKNRQVKGAKRVASRLFVDKPSAFRRRLVVMWKTG